MSVLESSRKMTSREQTAYDLGFHEGQNAAIARGQWIPRMYDNSYILYHCSECCAPNARERNYCPNCGAKMDGGNENG